MINHAVRADAKKVAFGMLAALDGDGYAEVQFSNKASLDRAQRWAKDHYSGFVFGWLHGEGVCSLTIEVEEGEQDRPGDSKNG